MPKRWLTRAASGIISGRAERRERERQAELPRRRAECSWIHGTRVANDPVTAPCTQKTAATAYRDRLTSVVSFSHKQTHNLFERSAGW